jgi:multidrug efflux pump subunit AcrB
MWIVRIALSRPYTFIVLALILLILGPLSLMRTPTDIFPDINIPIISVVWNYAGMPPEDMGNRITSVYERVLPTTVNDVEHIESESFTGVGVVKIFFQPGVNINIALSQVTAVSQTMLRSLPPGTLPPLILNYTASSVPILQLILSSPTIPEQDLFDFGNSFLRTQLVSVAGASLPFPYGGKLKQIQVDLNPQAMQTYGVSAQEINAALDAQNLIIPGGTQKIGVFEYIVKLNGSPLTVEELNDLPVKATPERVLYIRDVAHVRDGFPPQTNIVRVDGRRAVMMSVQKTGDASTITIVKKIKSLIPRIKDILPEGLSLGFFSDQSVFVTAAIQGVITEGIIAAALTALMILLFLGSWRSTLIITVSIPLSIIASTTILSALGETINIMTLGGLALAVGILVDDATVAIENINWNLEQGKEVEQSILDGAEQIAIPALVSTLCICIVFVPMFYIGGVAQFLFVPLAEAVIFAMLASYLLSRTLIPTLAKYLLKAHHLDEGAHDEKQNIFSRFHSQFEHSFERFRRYYLNLLTWVLKHPPVFINSFLLFILASIVCLWPNLGADFFPSVDAGQIKLHIRGPIGMRIEEAARLVDLIDREIRTLIPANELDTIVDNIGLPVSGINITYSNSAPVGASDADILIALKPEHKPTLEYEQLLREKLQEKFPYVSFAFLPADIVSQIINFGLPSAVNVQVIGFNKEANHQYANKLLRKLKEVPGLVDLRIRQGKTPELFVKVDRSKAIELGMTQANVANSLLISLAGSFQIAPTFWLNPQNGVSYPIAIQTPQYRLETLQALKNTPIVNPNSSMPPQILGAVSSTERTAGSVIESHYNVQPVIDIFASIHGTDLASIATEVNKILDETKSELPKGSQAVIRGQIVTQHEAFSGLYWGIAFSIILIYLLIVINFQSWLDPFIIITALPSAIAGIAWLLFLTGTALSVPALTGAIMCMGVATANSILIISTARHHLAEYKNPLAAALEAGKTRVRPVLMTALAMIIGMMPMALGLGDGGEQNAPLGRAVIGGLSFATITTLLFVPTLFYVIHHHQQRKQQRKNHA